MGQTSRMWMGQTSSMVVAARSLPRISVWILHLFVCIKTPNTMSVAPQIPKRDRPHSLHTPLAHHIPFTLPPRTPHTLPPATFPSLPPHSSRTPLAHHTPPLEQGGVPSSTRR
jgi:hypothetical protein